MKPDKSFQKCMKYSFFFFLAAVIVTWAADYGFLFAPALIATFSFLALYFMSHRLLKSYAFTVWVLAFVTASMVYPQAFMTWFQGTPFEIDLGILIVPLIQVIMFGMGTTLSTADFGRIFKAPWPIFIGFLLQFSVMPLVGLTLAKIFKFGPEIAAGMVLVGSCPGGVASNLMTYLAGGDVALSVTMTSCSTLASPVMTPFLMKMLAGKMVPVNFFAMMFSIVNMIIVPIVAGLFANRILYGKHKLFHRSGSLLALSIGCIFAAVGMILFAPATVLTVGSGSLQKDGIVVGLVLIGTIAFSKLVISLWLKKTENWMDKALPVVSMAGICFILAIIVARSAEDLKTIAKFLIAAVIVHNAIGYILGYWGARVFRLKESTCRTVAIEVGLQNGGMATGLAMDVLKSSSAALAPAIFGSWMNVSGSILATWWRRKPSKG
jgi:BASS family bile acid:Na+ symporter